MKFDEALLVMMKGSRVRRTNSRNQDVRATVNEKKTALVKRVTVAEYDVAYTPTLEDLLAEDWEVAE